MQPRNDGVVLASFELNTFALTENYVIQLRGRRTRGGIGRPVAVEYWMNVYNDGFYPCLSFSLAASTFEEAMTLFKNEILGALDSKFPARIEWWKLRG